MIFFTAAGFTAHAQSASASQVVTITIEPVMVIDYNKKEIAGGSAEKVITETNFSATSITNALKTDSFALTDSKSKNVQTESISTLNNNAKSTKQLKLVTYTSI